MIHLLFNFDKEEWVELGLGLFWTAFGLVCGAFFVYFLTGAWFGTLFGGVPVRGSD